MNENSIEWPEGFDSAPSILLVDDEINIVNSIRRLLRPTGFLITTASSGEQAIKTLEQEPVDLIISDMRMPGMNGAQLLEHVRKQWPWTVRVLLTGHSDISSAISAINQGEIYRYISKPWNDSELLMTIRRAIERRGLEKEYKRLQILTNQQNEELKILNASLEEKVRERTQELARTHDDLVKSHDSLKQSFLGSIKIFSGLIDMRIGSLTGHSRRVADLARKIAERMGLSKSEVQDIIFAGLLHNIGKIGLPDHLITKPYNQIPEKEFELIKQHPIKGSMMLMALAGLKNASKLIRQQHERHDGYGFPEGLAKNDIPVGARILALAIDFDAVQHGLRLPKNLSAEEAKKWIIEGKDSRYSSEVIAAFLDTQTSHQQNNFIEKKISSKELVEGMILERDLTTHDGTLLVASGHILDNNLIQQICDTERSEQNPLIIWIRCL